MLSSVMSPSEALGRKAEDRATIVVTGGIQASARLSHDGNALRIEGQLKDERSDPLAGQLSVLPPDHQQFDRQFVPCGAGSESPMTAGFRQQALQRPLPTTEDGHFCFESAGPPLDTVSLLARSPHHETTRLLVESSPKAQVRPRIVRAPDSLTAGDPQEHAVETLLLDGRTRPSATATVELSVSCGSSRQLVDQQQGRLGELVRLEFTAQHLRGLGLCKFEVTTRGPEAESAEKVTRPVLVQGRVRLELQKAWNSSGDQAEAVVLARGLTGESKSLPTGVLEARDRGAFVASCPLNQGLCQLSFSREKRERSIQVRFIPGGEEWLVGNELSLTVQPSKPTAWPTLVKALLLGAFGLWLLHAWLGHKSPPGPLSPTPHGHAHVTQAKRGRSELHGEVIDAHTGSPVGGAHIALLEVTPRGDIELDEATADESGAFELKTRTTPERVLRVRITREGYVPFDAMVRGSYLGIQVTARRRALLESLLAWARAEGLPFRPRIPGPAEISSYAEHFSSTERAQWAQKVAQAAYGPQTPTDSDLTVLSDRQQR